MIKKSLLLCALVVFQLRPIGVPFVGAITEYVSKCFLNNKKVKMRTVEVVNDISDLIEALPQETEEFQESVYYTVRVNGKKVELNQKLKIVVYDDKFTILIKSKIPLIDHIDSIPKTFKKALKKGASFFNTYYTFTCHMSSDVNKINLAFPALYGCAALKKREHYTLSYKWPRGIKIALSEVIECQ